MAVYDLQKFKDDFLTNTVRVDFPKAGTVQPYLIVTRFDILGDLPGSGTFVYGGLKYSSQIDTFRGKPVILGVEYRVGYCATDGLLGTSKGLAYHRLTVSQSFQVNGWTITPAWIFQASGHGQKHGRAFTEANRVFASINISKGF